ncbi:rhodanese-like domain-containing protein [Flagellimonas meridianipacifica]|uniref:Rhodanese-related sulfurtransferase n=1 Tax=Flagellimonas meridianipacifica TaxID=1080225 RepID=A0A2T0MHX8_9FLAO|nr:rhodanese-like domain-containing protein [Allomuricauda pacifica]PRX57179.1 rhodanese-related sulfurtransferase [Allomuricauda pacifica]
MIGLRISLIAVLTFCLSCNSGSEKKVRQIELEHIVDNVLGKDVQFVDVRTPKEYKDGHIDDAVNFNIKDRLAFLEQIESLSKEKPVYLYCKSGVRSKKAAELLKKEGFSIVFDYSGGYDDWKENKN